MTESELIENMRIEIEQLKNDVKQLKYDVEHLIQNDSMRNLHEQHE